MMLGPQARARGRPRPLDHLTCGLMGVRAQGWLRAPEKALATEPRRRGCLEPLLLAAVSLGPWALRVSDPGHPRPSRPDSLNFPQSVNPNATNGFGQSTNNLFARLKDNQGLPWCQEHLSPENQGSFVGQLFPKPLIWQYLQMLRRQS